MVPPPLSCKKLVEIHPKLKPEFEGSAVRRRLYPAQKTESTRLNARSRNV